MTRQAEYNRRRRAEWRAAGKCPHCGDDPVPGKTRCAEELERRRVAAGNARERKKGKQK